MQSLRFYIILTFLVLTGLLSGLYLALNSVDRDTPEANLVEEQPLTDEVASKFPEMEPTRFAAAAGPEFPKGSVSGELVIHFENRKDYLAYLAALMEAGEQPQGQIDKLLAIRISDDALFRVDLGKYGARASYSYTVQRPLPPVEIDPVALAGLRGFGVSARSITGGTPHGDGAGVAVAILDSGIKMHPQFEDTNMTRLDLAGGGTAGPGAAHGTSVASIISGNQGIAPKAELFVVRVLDENGLGSSFHVAEGIVQAVDLGVEVINMSLGVYQDSPLMRQAVQYAHDRGVLMVAAAGNDGYNAIPFPAAYEEVLAVTAVDSIGQHAVFPNQSEKIGFAAPGVGVVTASEDSGTGLFSGTSAAAPFVSGTLASLMSGDEPMPAADAVELLRRHLNDAGAPGPDAFYGAGALDWNRLRERTTPGILDVAIAGIHMSPEAQPGMNMPVEITVQNRGTKWLNQAELEVLVDNREPVKFSVGTLGPGQTTTRKVFVRVPQKESESELYLAARVLPEDLNEDVRLENNLKEVQYRP